MRSATKIALGLALVTVAGLGAWLYTPDEPAAALDATYRTADTEYLTVDGVRLRVRDSGPRSAPVVLMLHGFGASLETWEAWAAQLVPAYRVIRFDLPGFGLTGPDPTGDYSDARALRLIAALLDQLQIAQVNLIGHSLGGRIAWRFAAEYPDRVHTLVLISPDGFASPGFRYDTAPDVPLLLRVLPVTLPTALLRMNLAAAYSDPARLSDSTVRRYRDLMRAPGVREAIIDRLAQVRLVDPGPLLERIRAPTLLLWGTRDAMIPFANAADYTRHIPQARLVPIVGLGHVPFEETPDAALVPVRAFLDANRGATLVADSQRAPTGPRRL
jgi:pimeloyl-ACP methyl ester carboxylesterase